MEQEVQAATGFLDPVWQIIGGWPVPLQVVGLMAILGIAWKIVEYKYLHPRMHKEANGFNEIEDKVGDFEKKLGDLEIHLTNHLTTDIGRVITELEKLNANFGDVKAEIILSNEKVKRHGDIQISTSRTLNEHNRVIVILADRLRIERPNHKRLPETDVEPFTMDG